MPPRKGSPSGKSRTNAAPKRMGSLSSFQPMLNFARVPSGGVSTSSPASASGSTSNATTGPSVRSASGRSVSRPVASTSESMPPPPLPRRGQAKSVPAPAAKGRPATKSTGDKGKGKLKMDDNEVVEVISSDEDDMPKKRRRPAPSAGKEPAVDMDKAAMWTDIFGPETEAELAPGKARITKVREWLYEAIHGVPEAAVHSQGYSPSTAVRDRLRKYKRILLVTGPAGIGKATTVRLLASQLGIDLVEWTEGVEERHLGVGFETESAISKLSSFLSRNAYPALNLGLGASSSSQTQMHRPRALLMTSLPNIGHQATRTAFHDALLSFCHNYTPSSCPLIIVHSESGQGGRAEESWMDRERGGYEGILEVVGREVKDGPWCAEIEFLSLAPTFLTKALNRVLGLAISDPAKRPSPGAVQLISLSANGDLRSAINSLQMLCSGSVLKNKKRKTGESREKATGRGSRGGRGTKVDVSDEIRAALDAVTRREQSLNLFHALGKVFYNKRLDDPTTDNDDQEAIAAIRKLALDDPLPPHLEEFERRKSMVQMETFIPTIPVDTSMFALWLHHNIPQFCTDVEQVSSIMDDLCGADLMRTEDDIWQSSPQAIAYALHLTVRGTLMGLPSPVPRNHQKVVKPQFFESYHTERANTSLLDVATGHLARKAVSASIAYADGEADDGPPWGGTESKLVLATETVPMAVKIQSLSRKPLLPISVQPLALQPYSAYSSGMFLGEELSSVSRQGDEDESFDATVAGEDGLGVVPDARHPGLWDEDADGKGKEQLGWLEDDDIEDFD